MSQTDWKQCQRIQFKWQSTLPCKFEKSKWAVTLEQVQPEQTLILNVLSLNPIQDTRPRSLIHPSGRAQKHWDLSKLLQSDLPRISTAPSAFLGATQWLMDIQWQERCPSLHKVPTNHRTQVRQNCITGDIANLLGSGCSFIPPWHTFNNQIHPNTILLKLLPRSEGHSIKRRSWNWRIAWRKTLLTAWLTKLGQPRAAA